MKMLLVTLLMVATTALARFGETEPQIELRYGKPISAAFPVADIPFKVYQFDKFKIGVGFIDGKSAAEILTALKAGRMEDAECLALIDAIAPGKWEKIPFSQQWKADGGMVAQVQRGLTDGDSLWIFSKAARLKFKAEEDFDFRKRIAGFRDPIKPKAESTDPQQEAEKQAIADALARDLEKDRLAREQAAAKKREIAEKLLKFHREKAGQGDPYGQLQLGLRYLKGDGVPHDMALAKSWLEKSAGQGNKDAQAELRKLSQQTVAK